MALIKLYEAANPTTLYGTETFSGPINAYGWYSARHDAGIYLSGTSSSFYKIYRDGTAVRCCSAQGLTNYNAYDLDADRWMSQIATGTVWYYNDPIGMKFDPNKLAPITYNPLSLSAFYGVVWKGNVYFEASNVIYKKTLAGGAVSSFSTTGSISRVGDFIDITPDGILVEIDLSNGTRGVARFYNLYTGQNLYESTFDPAVWAWVDRINKNIWTIHATTKKMQVWSFNVAPTTFSSITMGANRSRYRQDALSVTLKGSDNEIVPHWPVVWTMSTSEGHLIKSYDETDANGVSTNTYCGPGADDYVGASLTIQVQTGY